jgi:hypothetical protein
MNVYCLLLWNLQYEIQGSLCHFWECRSARMQCCFIEWVLPDILEGQKLSFARIRRFQTSSVPLAQQHSIIFHKIWILRTTSMISVWNKILLEKFNYSENPRILRMFVDKYRLCPTILIVIFNNTGSLIYLTSVTRHILLLLVHVCAWVGGW